MERQNSIDLVLRVYPGTKRQNYESKSRKNESKWPSTVLVFDTETTIGPEQDLLFGAYMWGEWTEGGTVAPSEEGLIYADDLEASDPKGLGLLRDYAAEHQLQLLSRREFVEQVLWEVGYLGGALIVGFNLPFDLSRLAIAWGEARGRDAGGFSLTVWDYWSNRKSCYLTHQYRPRLVINHVDSTRSFISFKGGRDIAKDDKTRGRFLDLRTFCHALTAQKHSLKSACEAFKTSVRKRAVDELGVITPETIEYCCQDVWATTSLLEATRREFDAYPIELHPDRAYSPASISKAFLRALGITPPVERLV